MSTTETLSYPLTWELDSLYPHPETAEFRSAVDGLKQQLETLATNVESLPDVSSNANVAAEWGTFLAGYAAASSEYTAISAFVGCHAAADALNKTFQKYEPELSALGPLQAAIATTLEFAFQSADDAAFDAFIAADSRLAENAFYLAVCRRNASLRLPKDLELLAADLDVDGLHAWSRLYDRLSGELRVTVMERGELVEKSPGQLNYESAQRSIRENNFFSANRAWSQLADSCADAINHISGSRLSRYRRLGIDHLTIPLTMNRMTRETLDTMWTTIGERKHCLVKYLQKKAELLGLERLAWYDLSAPLPVTGTSDSLSYDEACRLVIESFSDFSPKLGDFAKMAIEKQWIEVEDRAGKRQGGFCTDLPTQKQSRIFMTYTNSIDSMSTLAHELGHAYHSFVLRDAPEFLRDYPMNLAETASTFAETVLGENRLAAAETKAEKLDLLDKMLGDAVSFLMNIHARFLFDDRMHQERANGELSAERLTELMLAAQKEAYCDALAPDGWNDNFWISKLHFYISGWPFYNFPYTFGYLLSLGTFSLAQDAANFPQQFDDFLKATGCMDTEDAAQSVFGYDLRQPDFWNRSLDIIEARVTQFLELAGD
jgi:oligoendopeptidase F